MRKPNDSMWTTHPDAALRVMLESIAKDEGNGYLNKGEARRLRNKANVLYRKGKRKSRA